MSDRNVDFLISSFFAFTVTFAAAACRLEKAGEKRLKSGNKNLVDRKN